MGVEGETHYHPGGGGGGWNFGHFHDMYVMYIFVKCVAFNFGFHFLCLGLIFWFSQK
jgi:hypothetical protein